MLYTEADLEASMEKIEVINFHEEKEVGGVRFWAYNAGHVLGAAMFMIEIAGVKVLYTGDFSRQEDRHLMAAEIPTVHPDILITVMIFCCCNQTIVWGWKLTLMGMAYNRNQLTELTYMKKEKTEKADSQDSLMTLCREGEDASFQYSLWDEPKNFSSFWV